REMGQPQRPGAHPGAVAAALAAGDCDVAERVGTGVAVALGVGARADADGIHHQDEGAPHATLAVASAAPIRAWMTGPGDGAASAMRIAACRAAIAPSAADSLAACTIATGSPAATALPTARTSVKPTRGSIASSAQ